MVLKINLVISKILRTFAKNSETMDVLSLFDGISCGQVALRRAGISYTNYIASEINKNAIRVTKHNFPDTVQVGDITELDAFTIEWLKRNAKKTPWILLAGSPCQSFSPTISSNTGFDGKSKLFFEFVRVMKELRPAYFLLENVVMKKEWEDVITEHMGVEPVLINSDLFSAQSRPRLYWTNIPIPELPVKNNLVLNDIMEKVLPDSKYFYKEDFVYHGVDKVVCATLNINGHDILKRVNSRFHKCQTLTAVCGGNQQKKVLDGGYVRKLTPLEYERLMTLDDNYTGILSDSARYNAIGNGWTVDVIAHILSGIPK
jgi:site-specific DNA-cytosine methylase